MVNKNRLDDAVDEAHKIVGETLKELSRRIMDMDEPSPVIVAPDSPQHDLQVQVVELQQLIRDMRRTHAEELRSASSTDDDRYRLIAERRQEELLHERSENDALRREKASAIDEYRSAKDAFEAAAAELDELKYRILPGVKEDNKTISRENLKFKEALDFYAMGLEDTGSKARRALGLKETSAFQEYVKPS